MPGGRYVPKPDTFSAAVKNAVIQKDLVLLLHKFSNQPADRGVDSAFSISVVLEPHRKFGRIDAPDPKATFQSGDRQQAARL
jgi:hypothetical protein